MSRWTKSRRTEWNGFCRALSRMGKLLQRQKAPAGGYVPPRQVRHPLIDIIAKAPAVIAAIGDIVATDQEAKGQLSWANVRESDGAATIRLNHKGTRERCQEALDAALNALRKAGHRIGFRDLIRHENQNGYIALIRVSIPTLAPQLGFAR